MSASTATPETKVPAGLMTTDRSTYLRDKARWILRAWGPHRPWALALLVLTAISAGVTLVYPLVFGRVVQALEGVVPGDAAGGADDQVRQAVLVLLAVAVGRWAAALYPGMRALVNSKIDLDLREALFARILVKGQRFFSRFRTGDLVTRLTDDIASYPKVAWFCCSGLFRALDSGSRVVVCLAIMLWLDWRLALLALLPVPGMIAIFILLHRRLGQATAAQRTAASETSDHLEAAFTGVTVLQAHVAEARTGDALARQLARRAEAEVRLARLWVLLSLFFQALNVVGQLVVVVVGGLRVIGGTPALGDRLELGDFFSFYLYLGLLLGPMMDLPNLFVTGRQAFVCMERLDELEAFDREGEGGACRGTTAPGALARLALEEVRFAYPVDLAPEQAPARASAGPGLVVGPRPALRGVSLELRRGERLALVGPIGGGKTTVARLLSGALVPDAGLVSVDGVPLRDLAAGAFRRAVGVVPQDPVLFTASLRENVVFGRANDEERLAWAIDMAGMTAEVEALGGLDHEVGLRGKGLSGGQRQRLTIARALYGEPRVLLLDDITAALDAENEERFWRRLLERWPDLTALVVTHRAATAQRMSRVVMLEDGLVVAQGAHDELLASDPAYRALWRLEETHGRAAA